MVTEEEVEACEADERVDREDMIIEVEDLANLSDIYLV